MRRKGKRYHLRSARPGRTWHQGRFRRDGHGGKQAAGPCRFGRSNWHEPIGTPPMKPLPSAWKVRTARTHLCSPFSSGCAVLPTFFSLYQRVSADSPVRLSSQRLLAVLRSPPVSPRLMLSCSQGWLHFSRHPLPGSPPLSSDRRAPACLPTAYRAGVCLAPGHR